ITRESEWSNSLAYLEPVLKDSLGKLGVGRIKIYANN
ncbi:hypothetical protein GWI33_022872, partial [Rhynchophorus ferrugineus]